MFELNTRADEDQEEAFAPDLVNNLRNPLLLSAIRALLYSNDDRNREAFFRTLLNSTLLVLTNTPPKTPKETILNYDAKGYSQYQPNTEMPLVQLNSDIGTLILPVFTDTRHVQKLKDLRGFHGLAVSTHDLLEMSLIAESNAICINPGSPEFIMLDRKLIEGLVADLKANAQVPEKELMTFHGHTQSHP